jgi:hypothetical protein
MHDSILRRFEMDAGKKPPYKSPTKVIVAIVTASSWAFLP